MEPGGNRTHDQTMTTYSYTDLAAQLPTSLFSCAKNSPFGVEVELVQPRLGRPRPRMEHDGYHVYYVLAGGGRWESNPRPIDDLDLLTSSQLSYPG